MADYISEYTGAQIDSAIGKANSIPAITENDENKVLIVNSTGDSLKYSEPYISNFRACGASVLVKAIDDDGNAEIGWGSILPAGGCGATGSYLRYSETDDGSAEWYDPFPDFYRAEANDVIGYHYEIINDEGYYSLEWVPGLPTIGTHDAGKALILNNCQYGSKPEWADLPTGIPAFSSDDRDKVLAVADTYDGIDWKTLTAQDIGIPAYNSNYDTKGYLTTGFHYSNGETIEYIDWTDRNQVLKDIVPLVNGSKDNGKVLKIQSYQENGSYVYDLVWESVLPDPYRLNRVLVVAGSCGAYYPAWQDGFAVPLATASDLNKVLTVTACGDGNGGYNYTPSWISNLPTYTASDIGKTLTVISDGDGGATLAWTSLSS